MGLINFIRPTSLTFQTSQHEVDDAHSYVFKPSPKLSWKAGQHGLLELKLTDGKTARKMFSLSSAPSENEVHITTYWRGDEASNFKKALHSLRPGDKARLRGPVGPLHVRDYAANNVFIAGGIGITPFRSIIVEALNSGEDLHATLLYSSRSNDFIFRDKLDECAEKLPNLSIHYFADSQKISTEDIAAAASDNSTFYISGAPKFIREIKKQIRQINHSAKIITDPFMGYAG